jgi:signal transduction histidine kinase
MGVEFWLYGLYFRFILSGRISRFVVNGFLFLFPLLWLLSTFLFGLSYWNNYVDMTGALFCIVFSVMYLYQVFSGVKPVRFAANLELWIAIGVFIFYSVYLPCMGIFQFWGIMDRDLASQLFVALQVAYILMYSLVALFYYQKRRFEYKRRMLEMESIRQHEILRMQLEAQEGAFELIGEELHDNIGQLLITTKILLSVTERSLPQVPDTLTAAQQTLSKAIKDVRALSRSLNREWLGQFNLLENLRTEVERINAARTVEIQVRSSSEYLPLQPEPQVVLFRILQELLQNSIKHANASLVQVEIESGGDAIRVTVKDNGKGMDAVNSKSAGLGISSIRKRTRLLGGHVDWISGLNEGVEVHIDLPVQALAN